MLAPYRVYYQRFFGLIKPLEVTLAALPFTHRFVKSVEAASLDEVYRQMQSEAWSPAGEARALIAGLHLGHTSMSAGDVTQDAQGDFWVCNLIGWLPLRTGRFWPTSSEQPRPPLWLATEARLEGSQPILTRLKISNDRDCLPPDAYTVEQFGWVAFTDLVTLAKLIEQRLGLAICLDLGELFYETEENDALSMD